MQAGTGATGSRLFRKARIGKSEAASGVGPEETGQGMSDITSTSETARDGFVFAATGQKYLSFARRAARNLRAVSPTAQIDLFTDQEVSDDTFDRVHPINGTRRPKMEALRRSRFARTVYLDCDVIVVAPMPEVFDLLGHFDIAGAHEQYGNAPITMQMVRSEIPACFRQINSGVLGIRKSVRTEAFLQEWQDTFEALKLEFDQPLLRELLFHSDLRLAVLPVEYNHMHSQYLSNGNRRMLAPRVLHLPHLHVGTDHAEPADQPYDPAQYMGERAFQGLQERIANDRSLGAKPDLRDFASETVRKLPFGRKIARVFSGRLPWV